MKKLIAVLVSAVMLCSVMLPALAESQKDETVYVLAAPNGDANKIIVSDWLTNPDKLETLSDVTNLADAQDVKGDAQLTDGVWTAGGKDVYYQGVGTAELPLSLKITYYLDDQKIAPADLAGKSGSVRIRFDYQVNAQATVSVNGQEEVMNVPFAVLTAALLENDVFTNVSVVNGQLVNDGDRTVVVGMALPGMQESLQLSTDTLTLPEYVEITADAENFALPLTLTVATGDVFSKLDSDSLNSADDLKADVTKLTDGMAQLLDGSTQMLSGLTELSTGASSLADGATQLSDGLNTLVANNDTLVGGSAQMFASLLSMANEQLAAAGVDVPALTMENYAAVLDGLLESVSDDALTAQARAQVEPLVRAQETVIREKVTEAVQAQVSQQVDAAVGDNVLAKVLETLNMTPEAYQAAKEKGAVSEAQQQQIAAAVDQQMASEQVKTLAAQQLAAQMASDEVKAAIDENTEAQIQTLIDQNVQSDAVQSQLASAKEKAAPLTALKAQLDSYNTFHTGLVAYTQGAASAAEGAQQLSDNMPALQSGIQQLKEGAFSLKAGLTLFNAQGIDKVAKLVNEDVEPLLVRARGVLDAAKSYENYSGLADDMDSAVRFIWRTDAIQP